MRLEVVIRRGCKVVIEGFACQLGLHARTFFECIKVIGKRACVLAHNNSFVFRLSTFDYILQHAQRIEAARKSRVGVELRESFFDLADRQSGFQSVMND